MIRSHQDFASGVMFIVAGAAFVFLACSCRTDTAGSMGPGYFPLWLGVVLMLLGVVAVVQLAFRKDTVDRIPCQDAKTLLWALGSVVLSGLLLQPLGLVLSPVVLVLVSGMASREFTLKGAAGTTIVMVTMSLATSVYELKLQLSV